VNREALIEGIWERDATTWTGSDEAHWLGWLDEPLHVQEGLDDVRRFAESVRDEVDDVVLNAAGGGWTMKEYHLSFADEPEYIQRVREFEAKVKDFSEWLAGVVSVPMKTAFPSRAASQDACHLRHAQKIIAQPRALLDRIEGLELVELAYPDQCCGSAGVYNLEHPDLSGRILAPKIAEIEVSGAQLVISANPGCILQIRKGLEEAGLDIPVKHIAEVLDVAMDEGARHGANA